jgi:hypothetical protein
VLVEEAADHAFGQAPVVRWSDHPGDEVQPVPLAALVVHARLDVQAGAALEVGRDRLVEAVEVSRVQQQAQGLQGGRRAIGAADAERGPLGGHLEPVVPDGPDEGAEPRVLLEQRVAHGEIEVLRAHHGGALALDPRERGAVAGA